jgi:flagellar hook-associated protein 2
MATTPPIRFTGLISGIDFDQVVDALLEIRRQPVLQLQRQKDRLRLQSELWREIQQKLSDLQSALSPFLTKGQALPFVATSSAPDLLQATANPNAVSGSYQVTVKQLATPHELVQGSSATLWVSARLLIPTAFCKVKNLFWAR